MKVRALVQARLQSERLPGKVLDKIGQFTILEHIARRLKLLEGAGVEVFFAIADEGEPRLGDFLRERGLSYYSGDIHNVLKRFTDAAADLADHDYVIRATGDNPFIDQTELAKLIHQARTRSFDYGHTADLPLGMGVEMVRVNALRSVMMRAHPLRENDVSELKAHHTEHVTTYIRENPHLYDIYAQRLDDTFSTEGARERVRGIRVTIDERADLEVCRRVYAHFERRGKTDFTALDLIELAKNDPAMLKGNEAVVQKAATTFDTRR